MTALDDPFRDVHRARTRAVCARVIVVVMALAVGAGLASLADAVPASPAVAVSASAVGALAERTDAPPVELPTVNDDPNLTAIPTQPAAAAALAAPEPASAVVEPAGPASWSIDIDTVGYQAAIDQCLWVRMNLGGEAPIVGAHNYCGGAVVLDMAIGDRVELAGTELDGVYVVTDARDARAGDSAPTAIAGMVGDVIVQTCYWGGDGRVRLVGLTRTPAA